MHKDIRDGQVAAVGLNPPAIVVVIFPAINYVVIAIHIHAVTIPIFGGGSMTAPTATAVHVDTPQGIAAMAAAPVIPRGAIDGNPLVLHVRHLDIVDKVVLAEDMHSVAHPATAAVDRQVADGCPAHPRPQRKPWGGALRGPDGDGFTWGALDGRTARGIEVVLLVGATMNGEGIATR